MQKNSQHLLFNVQVRSLPTGEFPVNTLLPPSVAEDNLGISVQNQLHSVSTHPTALTDDSLLLLGNTEC